MGNVVFFDCQAGIAGDMALAALIHAGADIDAVVRAVDAVARMATGLAVSPETGSAIRGLRLDLDLPHEHEHRTLAGIIQMIESARGGGISERAADTAGLIFRKLAQAEAAVHGCPVDEVHFHEVGAMDSIVDIVGTAAALDSLNADQVAASPLPMTRGIVRTMHGAMPIPAPATLELLRGYEVYGVDIEGEFVTPTGAAICAALAGRGTTMPSMKMLSTGYGFGRKKWPDGRPNCVRAVVGTTGSTAPGPDRDHVVELSANIDDSTPDLIARLTERLLGAGALDAWIAPIQMKKGRPGWMVSALGRDADCESLARLFFTESTTIGVRIAGLDRVTLERTVETVTTKLGAVRVKTAWLDGERVNVLPEADDLRAISDETGLSLKAVRRLIESEIP